MIKDLYLKISILKMFGFSKTIQNYLSSMREEISLKSSNITTNKDGSKLHKIYQPLAIGILKKK